MEEQKKVQDKRWWYLAIILSLIGMGLSVYSVMHHREVKSVGETSAACNISESINCDAVALSEFSEVAGLPLGVYGLGYFFGLAVLLAVGATGFKSAGDHLQSYVFLVGLGLLSSVVLAGISVLYVKKLCIVCLGVYLVTALQGINLGLSWKNIPKPFNITGVFSGAATAAIVLAIFTAGYNYLPPVTPKIDLTEKRDTKPRIALAPKKIDIPISRSAYAGLGEDYRKGPDHAKVVLVEFADFQCPACRSMDQTLAEIANLYSDKVQIVFRNYPLDSSCNAGVRSRIHDYACKASLMARCAGQYGKFWDYHKKLFDNQRALDDKIMKTWAMELGLTEEQIKNCEGNADILAKIKDDIQVGDQLGVDATPTLFINSQKVTGGRSLNDLRYQIDLLLQQ